jgi:modulator of FtsH protease
MSGWETRIATGNYDLDRQTVEQHRQAAAAQGLGFDAQPLPTGGYYVRAFPAQGYGAPQPSPAAWAAQRGQPVYGAPTAQVAYSGQGGMGYVGDVPRGGVLVGGSTAEAVPALSNERIKYLRKVYGLLSISVLIAIVAGYAAVTMGGTVHMRTHEGYRVAVPALTAFLLSNRMAMYLMFGLLFVGTLGAGAVSKVRGLNLVALFGVSGLMGVEVAPMVFVAQLYAHMGKTLSAAPVADTFLVVGAVFVGATSYVFITRKDFSYLYATLAMGFWVVFVGAIAAAFIDSNVFSLAIATVGAIVAAGLLLVTTSRVFQGPMDDAVGDCLGLLVQLRNLFVFLLRIFMNSSRR